MRRRHDEARRRQLEHEQFTANRTLFNKMLVKKRNILHLYLEKTAKNTSEKQSQWAAIFEHCDNYFQKLCLNHSSIQYFQ